MNITEWTIHAEPALLDFWPTLKGNPRRLERYKLRLEHYHLDDVRKAFNHFADTRDSRTPPAPDTLVAILRDAGAKWERSDDDQGPIIDVDLHIVAQANRAADRSDNQHRVDGLSDQQIGERLDEQAKADRKLVMASNPRALPYVYSMMRKCYVHAVTGHPVELTRDWSKWAKSAERKGIGFKVPEIALMGERGQTYE